MGYLVGLFVGLLVGRLVGLRVGFLVGLLVGLSSEDELLLELQIHTILQSAMVSQVVFVATPPFAAELWIAKKN